MHRHIPIFSVLISFLFTHTAFGQSILSAFANDGCISGPNGTLLAQVTNGDIERNNGCMAPGQFRSIDFRTGPNADVLCTVYADALCSELIMILESPGCQSVPGQSILCFQGVSEDLPASSIDVPNSPTTVTSPIPDFSTGIPQTSDVPQLPTDSLVDMTSVLGQGHNQLAMINPLSPKGDHSFQLARL
jgi:hypothetical protein